MAVGRPRFLTIPPGVDFLSTLAGALIGGRLIGPFDLAADPLALARATVYLPNRRAARAFAAVMAETFAPRAVILPRILPLGDAEDDELALEADDAAGDLLALLPPAIDKTERLVEATRFVLHWSRTLARAVLRPDPRDAILVATTARDALALAGELAGLLDTLAIEGKGFEDLRGLVPEAHDRIWGMTLEFLRIAAEHWPERLAARGLMDQAARRDRIVRARAALHAAGHADPVVVAGSTGSMPATAELLAAVGRLPRGAVVLPGFDTGLDADDRAAIEGDAARGLEPGPSHPQALMLRLVRRAGLDPAEVETLGTPPPETRARARFLAEALRPAATTDRWAASPADADGDAADAGLAGLALVEAADEREAALVIALALREAVEIPGRTAALVTPDRALAERVAVALGRWGIAIDDSAGSSLARSPRGVLAGLAARLASADAEPRAFVDLLAHPDTTFGWPRERVRAAAAAFDLAALRGRHVAPGFAGLAEALAAGRLAAAEPHASAPARRLRDADFAGAEALLDTARAVFAPLTTRTASGKAAAAAWAARHRATTAAILGPEADGAATPDAEALTDLLDRLEGEAGHRLMLTLGEYAEIFDALARAVVVRPPRRVHPRLKIWGLLEARLLSADRLVLAGLEENVWPAQPRLDPFLDRAMRATLGLPAPERRIGQSAHDFLLAAAHPDAILVRAVKSAGVPTVASRFWRRLEARASRREGAWKAALARGDRWLGWARRLDRADPVPARRPDPKPATDLVPMSLSVTEVETLIRDPYAVFARRVLGLEPLEDIGRVVDARSWGIVVHEAAAAASAAPEGEVAARFLAVASERAAVMGLGADVMAFWRPRLTRIAAWFANWDAKRRAAAVAVAAECAGRLAVTLPDGAAFTLRARADRIERLADGFLALVDFKTGRTPSGKQVVAGFAAQMPLEAAMAAKGAFADQPAAGVTALTWVKLGGKAEAGEEKTPKLERDGVVLTPLELGEEQLAQLAARLVEYRAGKRGFLSRAFPEHVRDDAPTNHLARAAEWGLAGGEDGEP